jgi:formamidopyrimidine-DNA glycosylase
LPELPEVETVRRGLEKLIVGRKILNVEILNEKSFLVARTELIKNVVGAGVAAARRRAKVLIIDLDSGYSLVIHLKMTGQIVVRGDEDFAAGHPTDSFAAKLPDKSTRVIFDLSGGARLFFNDQRKFGWIKLLPTIEVAEMDFIKKLGPEPLTGDPEKEFLKRVRRRNNTTIKAALLDQTVIAGIGNIYADESLWGAKVHPATRVRDLSDKKLREILRAAADAMNKSLAAGGSSMKNYVRADGSRGNYLDLFANVFAREGQPCPRCGTIIEKIRVAGRGTHICPKCQKI